MKERRVSCFRRAWTCLLDVLLCRGNLEQSMVYLDELEPVAFTELFRYTSVKDRLFILFGCLSAAIGGVAQPMIFVVDGYILSTYLAHEKQRSTLFHDVRVFLIYCGIIGIIQLVATFFQTWFLQRSCCNLVKRLRRNFISSILKEKDPSAGGINSLESNSKLNLNIEIIEDALNVRIGSFIRAISLVIAAVAVCFRINWKVSLTALAMGPVTAWTLGIVGLVLKPFVTKIQGASEESNFVLEESIMNLRTVVACNAQDHMEKKFTKIISSISTATRKYNFWLGFFNGLARFEIHALTGVTFIVGIYGFYSGWVKRGGDVILIVNVMSLIGYYLGQLGQHFQIILRANLAFSTIYELLDTNYSPSIDEKISLKEVEGKLELDNITLKNPETDKIILKDVSLDISPGQTVAFVGLNAVGKDIIDLLAQQVSPHCGEIKLDGLSLHKIDVHSLRQFIGIVNQEPQMFNGSILENILLGRKGISSDEAKLAAKITRADEFITKFPKDYRTVFGVGGVALSVGQKQRIAIARALANDPKIFILDEPTANLDVENERIVQIILNQTAKERTTILITQQVSSLKEIDKIYLFENGQIVESGSYLELMERGKAFAKLVKIEELQNQEDLEKTLPSLAAKRKTMKKNKKSVSFDKDLPEEKEDHVETKEKGTNGLSFLYLNLGGNYIKLALAGTFIIFQGLELPLIGVQISLAFKAFQVVNKDRWMDMSHSIMRLCLICGAICLFATTGIYYFTGLTTYKMISKLKIATFRSLLNRPFTSFDKPQSSPTICLKKLKTHIPNCAFAFDHHVAITLVNLTGVVVGLAMAFFFQWEMGLLGYGLCFVQFMITVLNIKMSNETRKRREEEDFSKAYQAEIVEHSKAIQTLTAENFFKKRYLLELRDSSELENEASFVNSVNMTLVMSFFSFSIVLCHCLNTYLIVKKKLPLETVIFAYLGTVVAAISVMQLAPYLPKLFLARTSARQLSKLIDDEDDIHTTIFRGEKPDIVGEVTLTHVDFAHPSRPDIKIARELSLTIKNGENVALVGVPGSGKSAIIPLLERFYIADWGQVLIDKSNVRNMNTRHLHSHVALVPKEPVLFRGSILENLTLGTDGISLKKVIAACKKANADKFIESFPQGYETNIGENGSRLTKSQRQRLAIARALIKEPKIIIFEQPRQIDNEESIQKALADSIPEKTSITIARKISSVQNCDRIFVFHKGSVVESGTPEELLQLKGRFSRLLETEALSS